MAMRAIRNLLNVSALQVTTPAADFHLQNRNLHISSLYKNMNNNHVQSSPFSHALAKLESPSAASKNTGGSYCKGGNAIIARQDYDTEIFEARKVYAILASSYSEAEILETLNKSAVTMTQTLVENVLIKTRHGLLNGYKALAFFHWSQKSLIKHSHNAYEEMICIVTRMNNLGLMWQLLDEMRANRTDHITLRAMEIVLSRMAEDEPLDYILDTFYRLEFYAGVHATASFNVLMRVLCKEKGMEVASDVFRRLKVRYKPDTETYNAILSGWNSSEKALGTVEEMVSHGIKPDTATNKLLMKAFCKDGKIKEAFHLAQDMRNKGQGPDAACYNMLIGALSRAGRLNGALGILEKMKKGDYCAPDVVTYNALIWSFCVAGRFNEACTIMDEMKSSGIQPNPRTYNAFIRFYYLDSNWKDAWNVYVSMSCYPVAESCRLLMKVLCFHGRLLKARQLWDEMIDYGFGCYPRVLDILIAALCDNGKLDDAESCFLDCLDKGHLPNAESWDRLKVLLELTQQHERIKLISERLKGSLAE